MDSDEDKAARPYLRLAVGDHLDRATGAGGGGEPVVGCEEDGVQCLGKRNVHGVPAAHGVTQVPRSREQASVPEAFTRPVLEVLDCLGGPSAVQPSTLVLAPDDAEDLFQMNGVGSVSSARPRW